MLQLGKLVKKKIQVFENFSCQVLIKEKGLSSVFSASAFFPLGKYRIAKKENLSTEIFAFFRNILSNKNRYLQAHRLQVPEKIRKNKLRKKDKKKDLQAICSQVLDFIDVF